MHDIIFFTLHLPPAGPIYKVPRKLLLNGKTTLGSHILNGGCIKYIEKQLYRKDINTWQIYNAKLIISDNLKLKIWHIIYAVGLLHSMVMQWIVIIGPYSNWSGSTNDPKCRQQNIFCLIYLCDTISNSKKCIREWALDIENLEKWTYRIANFHRIRSTWIKK